ncbi:MAG TPA: FHA domain-containing protein [Blastocatellia bacterium]|nr:FHA domain-containing protein [Blastocatellia bacterium]
MEIWLEIHSQEGSRRVTFAGDRMVLGRGETADVQIAGAGLSRRHASIHRDGDRLWILDEGSANGVTVNGAAASPQGTPLSDGDEIRLSDEVTILVRFEGRREQRRAAASSAASSGSRSPRLALAAIALLGIFILGGIAVLAARQLGYWAPSGPREPDPTVAGGSEPPGPLPLDPRPADPSPEVGGLVQRPTTPVLYLKMSREQQDEFLDREARRVTVLIGNREYVFEREVLGYIKEYVDSYARRVRNGSTARWGEDLNYIFERARQSAPYIIASFRRESVPVVLGLYIPMVETEYNECLASPVGALGLFQFMPGTARDYNVSPADRCRIGLMAPAAARYMRDRIREFGSDGMSVALSLAAYNRGPDSVRRDLQDVVDSRSNERSFWTLVAKKEKLDKYFRNENIKYVPKFFAATIVGENPEAFGLRIRKLSTYDQEVPLRGPTRD